MIHDKFKNVINEPFYQFLMQSSLPKSSKAFRKKCSLLCEISLMKYLQIVCPLLLTQSAIQKTVHQNTQILEKSKMGSVWSHKSHQNCTYINLKQSNRQKQPKGQIVFFLSHLFLGQILKQELITTMTHYDRRLHLNPKTDCASLH